MADDTSLNEALSSAASAGVEDRSLLYRVRDALESAGFSGAMERRSQAEWRIMHEGGKAHTDMTLTVKGEGFGGYQFQVFSSHVDGGGEPPIETGAVTELCTDPITSREDFIVALHRMLALHLPTASADGRLGLVMQEVVSAEEPMAEHLRAGDDWSVDIDAIPHNID